MLKAAQRKRCVATAEYFALRKPSPADVTVEEVAEWSEDQVACGLKKKPCAQKAKCLFLATLRECGFTEQQPVESARHYDYAVRREYLPEPLKSEIETLLKWMLSGQMASLILEIDRWVLSEACWVPEEVLHALTGATARKDSIARPGANALVV